MKRPSAPNAASAQPGRGPGKAARPAQSAKPQTSEPGSSRSPIDTDALQTKAKQFAQKLADERRHAAWLSGFRFSTFSLIMAGVLIVGVLSLIPRVQELATQRQQIDALKANIAATQADIEAKKVEREQWNDTTFIETQARERLFYVEPGDVSYLVINDLTPAQLASQTQSAVSTEVKQTESQWLGTLLGSVWAAGNAAVTVAPTPAPATTPAAQ